MSGTSEPTDPTEATKLPEVVPGKFCEGYSVWKWPEFIALAKRLGVYDPTTKNDHIYQGLVIELGPDVDDPVHVTHSWDLFAPLGPTEDRVGGAIDTTSPHNMKWKTKEPRSLKTVARGRCMERITQVLVLPCEGGEPVSSYEVYRWPEFCAFCWRLNIPLGLHTRGLRIELMEGEAVNVTHTYQARDRGPAGCPPTPEPDCGKGADFIIVDDPVKDKDGDDIDPAKLEEYARQLGTSVKVFQAVPRPHPLTKLEPPADGESCMVYQPPGGAGYDGLSTDFEKSWEDAMASLCGALKDVFEGTEKGARISEVRPDHTWPVLPKVKEHAPPADRGSAQ